MKSLLSLKRSFKTLVLCAAAAFGFTSCIDGNAVVTLTPAGSGTLAATVKVTPSARAFMKQQSQGADVSANMPSEEEMRDAAKKMGEGVTLTKCEPIKDGTELIGYNIEYAFTDIRKLNLGEGEEKKVKLDFTPGKTAKLALELDMPVDVSKPEDKAVEKAPAPPANDPNAAMEQQMMLAMMKQIAAGSKIKVTVKPGSKITKSNATHVKTNEITVLDVNLDEVMTDPKFVGFMKDMQTMPPGANQAAAIQEKLESLKGMKGIKVETNPKVEVDFE